MNDEQRAALAEDTSADALDDIKKIQQEFGLTFSLADSDRIVFAEQRTINDLFFALAEARHLLAEHDIDAMLNAVHPETWVIKIDRASIDSPWATEIEWLTKDSWRNETGIGTTRTAAIADACRKAIEALEAFRSHYGANQCR